MKKKCGMHRFRFGCLRRKPESLLIDLELVGESSVAVEEVLLHRPLGQPIPIPELDGVVDVIQDRELGPLGVVEHFVVVGGVQPQILPTAHAGLAIQHLDTVEAAWSNHWICRNRSSASGTTSPL
ncbi:MAG: hypothetical protein ACLUIW_03465 [Dysosmobacter welbionis]